MRACLEARGFEPSARWGFEHSVASRRRCRHGVSFELVDSDVLLYGIRARVRPPVVHVRSCANVSQSPALALASSMSDYWCLHFTKFKCGLSRRALPWGWFKCLRHKVGTSLNGYHVIIVLRAPTFLPRTSQHCTIETHNSAYIRTFFRFPSLSSICTKHLLRYRC